MLTHFAPHVGFVERYDASGEGFDGAYNCELGLPTRTEPPTDEYGELLPCEPYLNATNDQVEWVEKTFDGQKILHTCAKSKWSSM